MKSKRKSDKDLSLFKMVVKGLIAVSMVGINTFLVVFFVSVGKKPTDFFVEPVLECVEIMH